MTTEPQLELEDSVALYISPMPKSYSYTISGKYITGFSVEWYWWQHLWFATSRWLARLFHRPELKVQVHYTLTYWIDKEELNSG